MDQRFGVTEFQITEQLSINKSIQIKQTSLNQICIPATPTLYCLKLLNNIIIALSIRFIRVYFSFLWLLSNRWNALRAMHHLGVT